MRKGPQITDAKYAQNKREIETHLAENNINGETHPKAGFKRSKKPIRKRSKSK